MKKVRLLILMDHYLPGYKAGGPIRSVSNLVENIADDFEVFIITSDHDFGVVESYQEIDVNEWNVIGGANVFYKSKDKSLLSVIRGKFRDCNDITIYVNSFFSISYSIVFFIYSKCGFFDFKKIILAPRGELGSGALSIKSLKKNTYIRWADFFGLYNCVDCWHATSEDEMGAIKEVFGLKDNVCLIENLVSVSDWEIDKVKPLKPPNSLRVVFLSRISRKKNLLYCLNMLSRLKECNIYFDIYGPIEDKKYFDECQKLIDSFPESVKVKYKGEVIHSEVQEVFSQYDLMFLPTLNENFGQIIWESLASACPVLISDRTPWLGLKEIGVGVDLPLSDETGFVDEIKAFYEMSESEYTAMAVRARAYAFRVGNKQETINKYKMVLDV